MRTAFRKYGITSQGDGGGRARSRAARSE